MVNIISKLLRCIMFIFFIALTQSCATMFFTEPVYKSESFTKKQEKLHYDLPDLRALKMYRLEPHSGHNNCPEIAYPNMFLFILVGFVYTNMDCTASIVNGQPSNYNTIADGAFKYQYYYIGLPILGWLSLPYSSSLDMTYENRLDRIETYKYPVLEEGLPLSYEGKYDYVFTPTKALVQIYPYLPLDKRKLLYKNEALFAYYEFKGRICDTDEIQLNVSRPHRPIALAACSPNS